MAREKQRATLVLPTRGESVDIEPLSHISAVAADDSHIESPACFSSISTMALPTSAAETLPEGAEAADDPDDGVPFEVAAERAPASE
jgi:hypothetical protein